MLLGTLTSKLEGMRYNSRQIIYSLIGVGAIAILIQFLQRPDEEVVCDKFRYFCSFEITGTVKSKFRDPMDHYKRIVIYDHAGREERLDLSLDSSGLYASLIAGDRIAKASNSSKVFINGESVVEVYFGYDCK